MRSLDELVDVTEPATVLVREWISVSELTCEVLPAGPRRGEVLQALQVTTRSPLGAIAYDTGGIFVDHSWLRFIGSGHPSLPRDLPTWNRRRGDGFFLVADDVVGGFFALNGGALGHDVHQVYYWPPDRLGWEPLRMGFSEFFQFALSDRLAVFYQSLRWPGWEEEAATVPGDKCFNFYPFLWTTDGSVQRSSRAVVPVTEAFDMKVDIVRQLGDGGA